MDQLEQYRGFTVNVVRLMVWYTWSQAHLVRSDIPIGSILDQHVDIRRKTSLYKDRPHSTVQGPPESEWGLLKAELEKRIEEHDDVDSTEALEEECWCLLAPYIEPVLEDTCPRFWLLRDQPYQCWSYALDENEPSIGLHFGNAYQPQSPFGSNRGDVIATLLQLLCDVQDSHPEVTSVCCGSWLNESPTFLDLFPASWRASVVTRDTCNGTWGWWGQYMDHRGDFHARNALILRTTGRHPYRAGRAQCDIDDAIAHLRTIG